MTHTLSEPEIRTAGLTHAAASAAPAASFITGKPEVTDHPASWLPLHDFWWVVTLKLRARHRQIVSWPQSWCDGDRRREGSGSCRSIAPGHNVGNVWAEPKTGRPEAIAVSQSRSAPSAGHGRTRAATAERSRLVAVMSIPRRSPARMIGPAMAPSSGGFPCSTSFCMELRMP